MKVIVIGGNAGGMSAAAKLKRLQPDSEIVAYEKGDYLSYAACGLPYFVADPSIGAEELIQRTPADFAKTGIMTRIRCEVLEVSPGEKKIRVKDLESGEEFMDNYDKLVIACGARPIVPPFPGVGLEGVQTLKSVADGIRLKDRLSREGVNRVAIIGGGAIGIEVAETLAAIGKEIRIIEMADRILLPFEPEIAELAHKELLRLGVEIHTSEKLVSIQGVEQVEAVITDKGTYNAEVVIMAIGVKPATDFLKEAGLYLAGNGAVIIDREMRTNLADIYAVGDCAESYHRLKEENTYIALATTANKCGRILGENLSGHHRKFPGTLGSAALKVGEWELARTGLSEKEAKDLKLDYAITLVETHSIPKYLHQPSPVRLKLLYEKGSRRILGAHGAGRQGVVLRIDVFATAIAAKMTTEDLGMLDLCYAPPFATTWDPVNIAAQAAK